MAEFTESVTPDSGNLAPNVGVDSNTNNGSVAEPSFIDIKDDSLIKAPGFDKPVKFSELTKRQQADYTKKTQELARQRSEWDRTRKSEETRLQELATQLLARQNSGQAPQGNDFLNKLRAKTYLDGQTAADLFQEIQEGGFGSIKQELAKRDQVIDALYKQVVNLQKGFSSVQGERANQAFESKIGRWIKEGGYPEEAADLMKEIYLAYEGEDLDNEFPSIFEGRWKQLNSAIQAMQRKKVDSARSLPFKLPGKGGQATAGKPIGLKGDESARDTADKLWEVLQASGGDET